MKRVLVILFLLIDITVMIVYFNINKDYRLINLEYVDKLDGSSYEDKIL